MLQTLTHAALSERRWCNFSLYAERARKRTVAACTTVVFDCTMSGGLANRNNLGTFSTRTPEVFDAGDL